MRSQGAKSISAKILLRSIAVALVPLIILAAVVFLGVTQLGDNAQTRLDESREALENESVLVTSEDQAASVAREINLTLLERINDVRDWARNQEVIDGAFKAGLYSRDEGLTELSIEELETQFDSTKNTRQALGGETFIRNQLNNNRSFDEIFFTDANGYNAALTNLTSDFVQSDEEWWQNAWEDGFNIDDIEFDESSGAFTVDIAVRIDDTRTSLRQGVMKATLNAGFVGEITEARSTSTTDYTVALADGQLVAESDTEDRSRLMTPDLDLLNDGVVAALAAEEPGGLVSNEIVYGYTRLTGTDFFDEGRTGFAGFDWVVVSAQSAETAFAPLEGLQELRTDINNSESNLQATIIFVLLAALALAALMARYMAKGITGPILQLTEAASHSAETGLPTAVDQINAHGAEIDAISVPAVKIETGDELEDLASSFNSVQDTAVSLAAEQALSRRNTSEMFVNLGRRNQALLKRQLRFIDDLEKNEADPDTLESLFKLDHLATRMRRNAESLLVLAGDRSPRRWAAPIAVRDGVQAALAEVEGYERVDISKLAKGHLQGNVAADMAHILAELIENALNFSPPESPVAMVGENLGDGGYLITLTDNGLGMSDAELATANETLGTVRQLSEVPSQCLGHYVVGRLADRHGVDVSLSAGESGGIVARVGIPASLTGAPETQTTDESPATADDVDGPADDEVDTPADVDADVDTDVEVDVEVEPSDEAEQSDEVDERPKTYGRRAGDRPLSTTDATDGDVEADTDDAVEPAATSDDTQPVATAETDGDSARSESVVVGGFEFSRRDSKTSSSPGRRAADNLEAVPADDAGSNDPDISSFGFTRRQSKHPSDSSAALAADTAVETESSSRSEDDTVQTAEHSRNRWNRFQRGREDAQAVGETDPIPSEPTDPGGH